VTSRVPHSPRVFPPATSDQRRHTMIFLFSLVAACVLGWIVWPILNDTDPVLDGDDDQ